MVKTYTLKQSKNAKLLIDFYGYCEKHPDERFWQALRNFSGCDYIYQSNVPPDQIEIPPEANSYLRDTFYLDS